MECLRVNRFRVTIGRVCNIVGHNFNETQSQTDFVSRVLVKDCIRFLLCERIVCVIPLFILDAGSRRPSGYEILFLGVVEFWCLKTHMTMNCL